MKQLIIQFNTLVVEAIMAKVKDKRKKKVTPKGKELARRVYKQMVSEYRNKKGVAFKVGDKVGLTARALVLYKRMEGDATFAGNLIETTRIFTLLPDVRGQVVLEQKLGGYWTWDVNDLEKV